jgi:hypothetical protein
MSETRGQRAGVEGESAWDGRKKARMRSTGVLTDGFHSAGLWMPVLLGSGMAKRLSFFLRGFAFGATPSRHPSPAGRWAGK